MSLKEQVIRQHLILKKVRQGKFTQKDIQEYLTDEGELNEYNLSCDRRTFKRALEDIASIYGIDIVCDKADNKYYIEFDGIEQVQERVLEALDVFQAFNIKERLSKYVQFDSRKPLGTNYIYPLFTAIKKCKTIELSYQAFYHQTPTKKIINPYALKESQGRWYLIGLDTKENNVKCYGLDRIKDYQITNKTFTYPKDFNLKRYFENSFGIIREGTKKPEKVIVEFDKFQAKYIKTYPLHHSQRELHVKSCKATFEYFIYITFDFIKELCSYGNQVKVLKPASLEKTIREMHRSAYRNYQITTLEELVFELNEILVDSDFSESHLNNILELLESHFDIEFKIIDLSSATYEFKEQIRDEKILMVLQQNFENAAEQRDREKKINKYLDLKSELGLTQSKFYLDGNKIFFCYSNTMKNDRIVKAKIENNIKKQ